MTYQEEIKTWLSNYKEKHFEKLPNGKWKKNQETYPHILPESHRFDNLLSPYKESFLNSSFKREIKFHSDFHHLNSSQAMCINLFYPLFQERKLELIALKLGIANEKIDYDSVCFEKDSEIERGYRPTSFDFYFSTESGKKIHFEIKYTEQEFGKAKKDPEHFEKYESVYQHHESVINEKYCNRDSFLENYQVMRNIINIGHDKFVVFIYPENNLKIRKQAEYAKQEFVKTEFKEKVFNITWEDLIEFIEPHIQNSKDLNTQLKEFKDKYRINKPCR